MKTDLLHTPEGVRDIYNAECEKKNTLQGKLQKVLAMYGYKDIQTPTFEFFNIFNQDRGTISAKEMYKFFDREGNTLVLRPDITPSIARAVSKYYSDEDIALRFSYAGNTFINNSSYQGRMKETTQMGAELIGDNCSDADAEIIALAIDLLLESGLTEFQLDIGHVEFFKAIIEQAGMDEETEEELKLLIQNKNYFGIEDLATNHNMDEELRSILMKMPRLVGGIEMLDEALALTSNIKAIKAVERLKTVYEIIEYYGFQKYLTFDLGMISEYNYYTGIIFRGYTYGTGDAIVKGGRYDHLLRQFGKDAASVGFALVIGQLMSALSRQKIDIPVKNSVTMILYPRSQQQLAVGLANNLRNNKMNVVLMPMADNKMIDDYKSYCKRHHIGGIFFLEDETTLQAIDVAAGTSQKAKISDMVQL